MKTLSQARGSNVRLAMGFESSYATAATSGFTLKFNPGGVSASRELNQAATIQPGRSPAEPFQGNGDVNGSLVFPNDLNQQFLMLKAAFGAPVTTAPASTKAISAVAASSVSGCVKLTVASGHGIAVGDHFIVAGTANYNGEHVCTATTSTTVEFKGDYTAETVSDAFVSKDGFTHVFKIGDQQPSFTLEQLHKDIAQGFTFLGCKVSSLAIGASSDGQENTVTYGVMGSKPLSQNSAAITAISGSAGAVVFTSALPVSVGDSVCIAGTENYDGIHAVTAVSGTGFTVNAAYVAETVAVGQEPTCVKATFASLSSYPLKRLGTFSASLKKDGATYKCAKTFTLNFDMGLDGDQRVIGDNGYRSELPEGTVGISGELTALYKDGALFEAGANNATVAWELLFTAGEGVGSLKIEIPECKIQQSSPTVDTAGGLSQNCTAQAFCSTSDNGGSAATITLVNAYAA